MQGVLLGQKAITDLPDDEKFWQEIRQQVIKEIQPLFLELMLAGVEFATEAVNLVRKKASGQKFNPHHDRMGRFASGGAVGWKGNPWTKDAYPGATKPPAANPVQVKSAQGQLRRQGRLNDDGTISLYHVTSKERLEEIKEKGLVPGAQAPVGQTFAAQHSQYATYFHSTREAGMADYLRNKELDPSSAIVEIRMPLTNRTVRRMLPDEDTGMALNRGLNTYLMGDAVAIVGGAPASSVRMVAGTKESAQKAGPIDTAIYIPDEDILAREIAAWLPTFTNSWYDTIEVTTRSRLRDVLAQAVREGQSIDWVYKSIEPLFGATRALRISQTEMTRIFAKGQDMVYAEAGVDTVEWRTVRDFAVCSDCAPLHGKTFPRNDPAHTPPLHVLCRCFRSPHIAEEAAAEKFNPYHDARGRFASGGRSRLVSEHAQLNDQLDQLAEFRQGQKPEGWRYGSVEELVQKKGRFFSNEPFTTKEKLTVGETAKRVGACHAKACYLNALHGATSGVPGVQYAEGFGLGHIPFPIDHAWLVVGNKPVDFTWGGKVAGRGVGPKELVKRAENNLAGNVYKGIVIPQRRLLEHVTSTGLSGPILHTYLKDGIPASGSKELSRSEKFNPYHDRLGRFATGGGGSQGQVGIAADRLITQAQAADVDVTKDIIEQASEHGGKTEGLEFRVKGHDSLERKIASESQLRGISPDEMASQIGDSLRYTIILPSSKYPKGAEDTIKGLQDKGYTLVKAKNYWPSNEYKGLNTNFISPSGHRFELQFHTPRTWDIKQNKSHPFFEKIRVEKNPTVRADLAQKMTGLWKNVAIPAGVLSMSIPLMTMMKELTRGIRTLFRGN